MARVLTVSDSVVVNADALSLYELISDPTRMGAWSPENLGATLRGDRESAFLGMEFDGHNKRGRAQWTTRCTVTAADAGKLFEFRVHKIGLSTPRIPAAIATWQFRFSPVPGGTRVTETWTDDRRGWPDLAARLAERGIETLNLDDYGSKIGDAVRDATNGRGTDSVIDAVGMEAHGSPIGKLAQQFVGLLPDVLAAPAMRNAGIDRLGAVYSAIDIVRRGGTVSLIGVYGGMVDPLPLMTMFDKQIQLRMGQANVKKWVDDIMPLLTDDDPLGIDSFSTHQLPLDQAPHAYEIFQKKQEGAVKIQLKPHL